MKKNYSIFQFLVSSVLLLLISACDTKVDFGYPEINVMQPLPERIYQNGDTIKFRAEFSDNNQLANIELLLVNQDNKPMLPVVSLIPDQNPYILEGDYILSDPMLPDGSYYIRFHASNGKNTTNQFVAVQIYGLEREMLYPIVVTHQGSDTWEAYKLAKNDEWLKFYTHNGDYAGCAINSTESQFYISGNSISNLSSVKLPEGALQWNVKPVYYQSHNWFGGLEFCYPNLYVSCAEGNIRGYNKSGNEIYKSETFPNAEPSLLVATKNFLVGAFADAFSSDRFLVAFHYPGGKMFSNKFFHGEIIGLLYTSSEKILVFSNSDGEGSISQYNATDNSLSVLHPFYSGVFIDAAKMDSDNYIISSSSGIYLYCISNNSLTPLVPEIKNAKIACDNTSQQFYSCSGIEMLVYSFPIPVLQSKIPLPDTIVDFHLVFNK